MGEDEFHVWKRYRAKRGTLNAGLRMEFLMARSMFELKKGMTFGEVVRYHEAYDEKPEETAVMDSDALAAMFGARKRVAS